MNEYPFILKEEILNRYMESKVDYKMSLKEVRMKILQMKHISKIHNVYIL